MELVPTRIGERQFCWGERTYIMGVLNLTPDSFSGDGLGEDVETAVALGLAFQEQGADAIDVGGESTRPAGPVYGAGALPFRSKMRYAGSFRSSNGFETPSASPSASTRTRPP